MSMLYKILIVVVGILITQPLFQKELPKPPLPVLESYKELSDKIKETARAVQENATSTASATSSDLAPVERVIDGDTVKIVLGSTTETVRLIGIDTPETVHPSKPVECFGKEASDKTKSLLEGTSVRIETDPSQGTRDKYGRLLAYLFLPDGTNVNQLLIAEGYAYEYTYNLPYKYQSQFKQAEKDAREQKRGLWADGVCVTTPHT